MTPYYLSGSISDGGRKEPSFERFNEKAEELRLKGYKVINPAEMQVGWVEKLPRFYGWIVYMTRDLSILFFRRPQMMMLRGWEGSRGARIERRFALRIGLNISYENCI